MHSTSLRCRSALVPWRRERRPNGSRNLIEFLGEPKITRRRSGAVRVAPAAPPATSAAAGGTPDTSSDPRGPRGSASRSLSDTRARPAGSREAKSPGSSRRPPGGSGHPAPLLGSGGLGPRAGTLDEHAKYPCGADGAADRLSHSVATREFQGRSISLGEAQRVTARVLASSTLT